MVDDGEFGRLPYSKIKKYNKNQLRNCYKQLFTDAEKKYNLKWYKANVLWYNKKTKLFNKGWEIKDGKWKVVNDFGYDFIFDKTRLSKVNLRWKKYFEKKVGILNPVELERLCSDKWSTYKMFTKISPKTFLVHDLKQLKQKLKQIKSDKIVIKPRFGSSAIGLKIVNKNRLPKYINKNTILQEFIDTSNGIKGYVKGVHDIRSIIINGKYIHSFIRVPRKGLVSNLSRGGRIKFLTKKKTPKKLINFVMKNIDKKLGELKPRFYTIDCVYVDDKIKLIEMNSKPGFFFYDYMKRPDLGKLVVRDLLKAIKEATY